MYHISCTEFTHSCLCLKSIACHSWNHWFASCIFFGVPTFQLLETWKQDLQRCPGCQSENVDPQGTIEVNHPEVDGRYCWWFRNPARNPVEVGSFSDFCRVFIHSWLFGFFPSTVALDITLFPIGTFWLLNMLGFRSSHLAQKWPSFMEKKTMHTQQLPVSQQLFPIKNQSSPTTGGEKKHTRQFPPWRWNTPGLRQLAVLAYKKHPSGPILTPNQLAPCWFCPPGAPDAPCAPASKAARINGFKCRWMGLRELV